MIGFVTLGTNNFDEAATFYDKLLATLGAARFLENERFISWGVAPDRPALSVIKPFNGEPATSGNGTMVAIPFESTDKVDAFHARALELGASNEGDPGPRSGGMIYCAYFRDLDGNKFNAFTMLRKSDH